MFAVVKIAGFQEKVQVGDTLQVPLQDAKENDKLTFEDVLMLVSDSGDLTLGSPLVKGAKVEAEVVGHGREAKVTVFKFRRRKRYMRTKGHKQDFTTITIKGITVA
jgi:large subunit ribosomal protein L21